MSTKSIYFFRRTPKHTETLLFRANVQFIRVGTVGYCNRLRVKTVGFRRKHLKTYVLRIYGQRYFPVKILFERIQLTESESFVSVGALQFKQIETIFTALQAQYRREFIK